MIKWLSQYLVPIVIVCGFLPSLVWAEPYSFTISDQILNAPGTANPSFMAKNNPAIGIQFNANSPMVISGDTKDHYQPIIFTGNINVIAPPILFSPNTTDSIQNAAITNRITITDDASHQTGYLNFRGNLNTKFFMTYPFILDPIPGGPFEVPRTLGFSASIDYPGPPTQSLVLGHHIYNVSMGPIISLPDAGSTLSMMLTSVSVDTVQSPEPPALLMAGIGLVILLIIRRGAVGISSHPLVKSL